MGNDLKKQYNLKQQPIRLPGSYSFLKFTDHPTDPTSSLIIIKQPHKAGIIHSEILLPIKEVKSMGYSDCTIATCRKCRPLGMVRPRSEVQMKLIIREIVRLGCEMGRIFLCQGRLMVWCEEIRSVWLRSPEEIEYNKQTDKSKVFWAGICLINFLHCVYSSKDPKKKPQKKFQIESFIAPKDKKQYIQLLDQPSQKLSKSSFWQSISEGMRNLILVMIARQPAQRIDIETLLALPYFCGERQLRFYCVLVGDFLEWEEKEVIIVMETLEMVVRDRVLFDQLVLNQYITPVLISHLQKKPESILSTLLQLPTPPIMPLLSTLKKSPPKNTRLFHTILQKIQKLHTILPQQQYDAVLSRAAFCSFQLDVLVEKLVRVLPFLVRTVKEGNLRKEVQFLFLENVIENKAVSKHILLVGLKCLIQMLQQNLLSNINKLFNLTFNPLKLDLQTNLHILQVYRLMITQIQPHQLISIMMPKLDIFLSNQEMEDQLFLKARRCVEEIMGRLGVSRGLGGMGEEGKGEGKGQGQGEGEGERGSQFWKLEPIAKPSQAEIIAVLRKEAAKSKNPDIVWLTEILDKQQALTDL